MSRIAHKAEVGRTKQTRRWWLTRVVSQFGVLIQDVFEILLLIRSWSNSLAPINRVPQEVLTLIPDSWDLYYKD